jgi:hypothetical protein
MNEKEKFDIDELLSGYLDGQLSERHCTEVKRLIAHDEQVARQLQQLEKCRELLAGLPRAKAPAGLVEAVKESLERRVLVDEYYQRSGVRAGQRSLFVRRLVAAAAMVALAGALGLVVFNILRPEPAVHKPLAKPEWTEPGYSEPGSGGTMTAADYTVVAGADSVTAAMAGQMKLELKTSDPASAAKLLSRLIYDSGLADYASPAVQAGRFVYSLRVSREDMAALLADLGGTWSRFDETSLTVAGRQLGEAVRVDGVSLEQLIAISQQDDVQRRAATARDFGKLNRIAAQLPGRQALIAIAGSEQEPLNVNKPVLTWARPGGAEKTTASQQPERVHLTIIVIGTEQ